MYAYDFRRPFQGQRRKSAAVTSGKRNDISEYFALVSSDECLRLSRSIAKILQVHDFGYITVAYMENYRHHDNGRWSSGSLVGWRNSSSVRTLLSLVTNLSFSVILQTTRRINTGLIDRTVMSQSCFQCHWYDDLNRWKFSNHTNSRSTSASAYGHKLTDKENKISRYKPVKFSQLNIAYAICDSTCAP